MRNLKGKPIFLCLLLLFVFISCQEAANEEAPLYPENEIPLSTESQEAVAQFVAALDHFDAGDARKARPLFEKALETDPDFVSAQIYRTWSSTSAKDFAENRDKALSMRDKATEGEALMLDVIQAGKDDDDLLQLEVSKKLVEKYPNSARAHENLGFAYGGLDQEEEARKHYAKAIEVNPDYTSAKLSLGLSYLFSTPKDFDKAQELLSELAETQPQNANIHFHLGDTYRAKNDLNKALTYYVKSAELDPENPTPVMKAGHANTFLGNYDEARKNYQEARKRSEFGNAGYNFEAFTYIQEGDVQKAMDFLAEKANEVDQMDIPDGVKTNSKMGAMFSCAMIARHHGNIEALKETVDKMKPLSNQLAAELNSEAAKINQTANMIEWESNILALEGDFEGAIAKAEEVKSTMDPIKDTDKLDGYHRAMSFIHEKQGNYEEMKTHLSELNMDNVYNKYRMAKAKEMLGETEEAMKLYEEVAISNFNNVGYAMVRKEVKEKLALRKS